MFVEKVGGDNAFFEANVAITDAFVRIYPARQGGRNKPSRFDDIMALAQRFHESFIRAGVFAHGYELPTRTLGFDKTFFDI